ncbi:hypothetical protein [Streptomyces atratus]|uniref:Phage baseplate protein n=1 Tax=Streptomyces atratus TaxID=1893 RepID=A0A2Z5JPZ3_STRAR|nr:hypothetical protein [Streptomyces atratus]AXE75704.1 hypothetical protein C5746_00360 [Streptomyces atratus]AXE82462.1 hypothetical protein C5746_42875 [Streptomyces atratus]
MPHRLTEANVLEVWEDGLGSNPAARSLLLASVAAPAGQSVADLPLSAVNSLLLEMRCGAFGDALPCTADCPACGDSLDVTVAVGELRPGEAGGGTGEGGAVPATGTLTAYGMTVTYRALTGRDVRDVDPTAPRARQALLRRCVVDVSPPADDLPDEVLEQVARRLPGLDPGADTVLTLNCPQCGHCWEAALDIADHLWTDVSGYAHRLLHEVHALARAYGWSEADVLSISPTRRHFYLEASTG